MKREEVQMLTLNGVVYPLRKNLHTITLDRYLTITKLLAERQPITPNEKDKLVGGGYLTDGQFLTLEEETEDFKETKNRKVAAALSGIPYELLTEYPDLTDILLDGLDLSTCKPFDDYTEELVISPNDKSLRIKPHSEWTFQQWADCENSVKHAYHYPFIVSLYPYRVAGKAVRKHTYDRANKDFEDKERLLGSMPAFNIIGLLRLFLTTLADLRKEYPYIYSVSYDEAEPTGEFLMEFNNYVGWEGTIASLAESGVFGTISNVRNANAIDVLDYLNVKNGKAYAEYKDYKAKSKRNNL